MWLLLFWDAVATKTARNLLNLWCRYEYSSITITYEEVENTRAGYKIMKTRGCNSVDSKHPSRLQNGFMKCKRKE